MGHDAHFDQKFITTLSRDSPYMMCIFGYAICLLHIEVIWKQTLHFHLRLTILKREQLKKTVHCESKNKV